MATYYIRPTEEPRFEGPFTVAQIRALAVAGQLGPGAMALEATGQNYWRLKASRDWIPVTTLLRDNPEEPSAPAAPPVLPTMLARRAMARYQESYRVAAGVVVVGAWLKGLAWVVAVGLFLAMVVPTLLMFSGLGGWDTVPGMLYFGAALYASLAGGAIYLLSLLFTVLGRLLQGSLDTAIHSSPFLTDDERARLMSLI